MAKGRVVPVTAAYVAVIRSTDYWVDISEIPGCISRGATPDAAKANFREALALHRESAGDPPAAPRTAGQLTKEELDALVPVPRSSI